MSQHKPNSVSCVLFSRSFFVPQLGKELKLKFKVEVETAGIGRNWAKQRTHCQAVKDWNSLDMCGNKKKRNVISVIMFGVVKL